MAAARIVVLAGLPGTGKSELARRLAPALGALLLDKDIVRAALFGEHVRYAQEQDDLVVRFLLEAARDAFAAGSVTTAVLDGRTWTGRARVEELVRFARETRIELAWIECACAPALARARLARARGEHVARNRSPELHDRLSAAAEPLLVPRLTLDTGASTPDELATRALEWLAEGR